MWSSRPASAAHKANRRKPSKASTSSSISDLTAEPADVVNPANAVDITDLLEPAVERPPSPERIRALNKQMRQNAAIEKHRSQQTTSSGSSSLLSATSERPSWEFGLDSLTLSRKSSQRSTTSSMPSRERRESVQIFGKTIFNRRNNPHGEHSDQSSSSSSLYSAEVPMESSTEAPRDSRPAPGMFGRRRNHSRGEETLNGGRPHISNPYNFQHLTHTSRESQTFSGRPSRVGSVSELRAIQDDSTVVRGSDSFYFSNFSSEALHTQQDPSAGVSSTHDAEPHSRMSLTRPPMWQKSHSSQAIPTRFPQRTRSQDQATMSPPRPPRPAAEDCISPIPPPPRSSSRVSSQYSPFGPLAGLERPATSTGFRQPRPFVPSGSFKESSVTSHPSPVRPAAEGTGSSPQRLSSAAFSVDEGAAWPLTSHAMIPLPEVPEEEENITTRRSRLSTTSNHSSLRGSVSVPLLRQLSQSQRPLSNASDTLGGFDLFAAQRALRSAGSDGTIADHLIRESWEDDIDYCYDHEAEADCDYAWERPSGEYDRDGYMDSPLDSEATSPVEGHGSKSPGLLCPPGRYDVPALSPASQISNSSHHEALTPTLAPPVTSNFSLPRRDSSNALYRPHKRSSSRASSFKESYGFDLSPSLLIPTDYHQEMLKHERDAPDEIEGRDFLPRQSPNIMTPASFDRSPTLINTRSSASTTNSAISEHSAISSNRHQSNMSTSTAFTRWTASTTSVDKIEAPSRTASLLADGAETPTNWADNGRTPVVHDLEPVDTQRTTTPREPHTRAQSHANLLLSKTSLDTVVPDDVQRPPQENLRTRRRAKTTSRSHNNPPPGQFALFPTSTMGPGRI